MPIRGDGYHDCSSHKVIGMNIFSMVRILPSMLVLSALVMADAAYADRPEADSSLANSLLPLETRSLSVQTDPGLFKSVANDINTFNPEASENSDISDLLGSGFLEGLVDEDGNVELPLGITVFDAMGTTSIGFGGNF